MKRRAFTLVEMCAVISAGGVLLTLAMGIVHRTMRVEQAATAQANVERAAALLARQFRTDIQHAESVSLDRLTNEQPTLRLTLGNQHPVVYRIAPRGLLREELLDEQQIQREVYALPDQYEVRFAELSAPPRIQLTIERIPPAASAPRQVCLQVEPVVGQLQSWFAAEEASQ